METDFKNDTTHYHCRYTCKNTSLNLAINGAGFVYH